jgi:hypothetical protein
MKIGISIATAVILAAGIAWFVRGRCFDREA